MAAEAAPVVAAIRYIAPLAAHIAVAAGNLRIQVQLSVHPLAVQEQVARPLWAVLVKYQQVQMVVSGLPVQPAQPSFVSQWSQPLQQLQVR